MTDQHERQTCTGILAVTKGGCQLFWQSSSGPESMLSVLVKPVVHHQCWAVADQYERQTCTGIIEVKQGCCQLFLQSSSGPESISVLVKPAVHQCWAMTDQYERQTCTGILAVTKGGCQLFGRAAVGQKACLVFWSKLLCISVGQLQTSMKGKLA